MAERARLVFLGGLGEIGRNCACVEVGGRIMVLDCGLMFPDERMPGVDLVLPDFTYLKENAGRIEGLILTHGHEDHTGGLSFLLRDLSLDVYGSALTLGLARSRVEEAGLIGRMRCIEVADGERRRIGPFDVEFIPVAHSVPNGFATAFHTPQGVILHTGDFKLDLTPVDGRLTDLTRIGALAAGPGIRLLLSDSTNAEEPGTTASETAVGAVLRQLFVTHRSRRIIATCFASHIHRISQIAAAALESGRVVATLGRSMAKNVALARRLGLLAIEEEALVPIEQIGDLAPERICVISTGSQGEPMSALALMAAGESRWLEVGPGDVVIMSSHAVPGNEFAVDRVIDGLYRRGAEVVHTGTAAVHSSGHAKADELKAMLAVARPECFVPVHGEYRHLVNHIRLATLMGVDPSKVLLCQDGDALALTDTGICRDGSVPAGYLFVDGTVGDVSHGVLRDRRALAEEGVVVVVVALDIRTGEVLTEPQIITRGWVHAPEAEALLGEARLVIRAAIGEAASKGAIDAETMGRNVRRAMGRFVAERTRRRPMIVPLVLEA